MILGVTGTNGAGKGTVVDYLIQKHGFAHFSVRAFLTEELLVRGLSPDDRGSFRDLGNELRKEHGPAYVIEQLYRQAENAGRPAVIDSVRAVGEAGFLHQNSAKLIAVDADRKIRYNRAVSRATISDKVSFEVFCEQEDREMASTEPWDMNIAAVMQMADFTVTNDGTLEELHAQIDALPLHAE